MKSETTTLSRQRLLNVECKRIKQELVELLQNEQVDVKKAAALLSEITTRQAALEWMEWSMK